MGFVEYSIISIITVIFLIAVAFILLKPFDYDEYVNQQVRYNSRRLEEELIMRRIREGRGLESLGVVHKAESRNEKRLEKWV